MTDEPVVLGGRYQLEEVIGRGGMAEVWRARDLRLDREVAIKRLRVDLATDQIFQARFQREAQAAAGLNHPNIVSVYDTGEKVDPASGTLVPYIVMELIQGHTLRDILRQGGSIQPEKAFEYTMGVLDALSYSHKHDIVHRDIKPANVMITPSGQVKVMDFGIARAVSDTSATMTQTAAVIGTAQYLSPEQARGEQVDARSDIYSAGCLLYELLTGRPPFLGDSPVSVAYQHVREMPVPPSQLDPEITPQMDAIVLKALAKNPDDRYQSARLMRDDCWRLLNGQPVAARVPAIRAIDPAMTAPTRALPPEEDDQDATHLFSATSEQGYAQDYDQGYEDEDYDQGASAEAATGRKKRRLSPATIVLIVLLAVLLAALGLFVWRILAPSADDNQVQVPSVMGFQEDAATEQLTNASLQPKVERVSGPAEGEGTVVAQDPSGGTEVQVGSTVTITINDGPPVTKIPTGLVGKTSDEAKSVLTAAGFTNVTVVDAPADKDRVDAAKGEVVQVSPAEGTEVTTDKQIILYAATGQGSVPDVAGQAEADARATLTSAGYTSISVEDAPLGQEPVDFSAGVIVSTRPTAGSTVSKSETITLVRATGRSLVPNVRGKTQEQAIADLNAVGFTNVEVVEQPNEVASNLGKVIDQLPTDGESAGYLRSQKITIYVAVSATPSSHSSSPSSPSTRG